MRVVADVGGTKTRIACAAAASALGETIVFPTPQDYEEGLARIAEIARSLAGGAPIEALALGAPGVLSRDRRILVHAPNLPQWSGAALADDLERMVAAPCVIENDTAMVGLGEARAGAGQGVSILAYVTISTGVNGVRIVDGAIDHAAFGFEIGEQILGAAPDAPTFEDLVSGRAIGARFGVEPGELSRDHPVWSELARLVAIGLHNTVAYWSPDRIVVGGSMVKDVGISIARVRTEFAALRRKNPAVPEIVHASLGDLGGLWGGLVRLEGPRSYEASRREGP
jgi:predicted NBD/HSP70 family sugar kinase